jgi:hypothetical protein
VPVLWQNYSEGPGMSRDLHKSILLSSQALTRTILSPIPDYTVGHFPEFLGRDGDVLDLETALSEHRLLRIYGQSGTGNSYFCSYLEYWWRLSCFAKQICVVNFAHIMKNYTENMATASYSIFTRGFMETEILAIIAVKQTTNHNMCSEQSVLSSSTTMMPAWCN